MSELIGKRKGRESLPVGRAKHTELCDQPRHQVRWRDVEGRVPDLGSRCRDFNPANADDLFCIPFLDGDGIPVGRG